MYNKFEIINKYCYNINDTGSTGIQIILLTFRINNLNKYLKINNKDKSCKRGLNKLICRRRKLINYLKSKNKINLNSLLSDLSIKN